MSDFTLQGLNVAIGSIAFEREALMLRIKSATAPRASVNQHFADTQSSFENLECISHAGFSGFEPPSACRHEAIRDA